MGKLGVEKGEFGGCGCGLGVDWLESNLSGWMGYIHLLEE